HAGTISVGNEVADWLLPPRDVHDLAIHRRAKLEIGKGRRRRAQRGCEDGRPCGDSPHRADPATARTASPKAVSDNGRRCGSPRTIFVPAFTTGGTTSIDPVAWSALARNTPCERPVGPGSRTPV